MLHNHCFHKSNVLKDNDVSKAFSNVINKFSTKNFTFLISNSENIAPAICIIIAKKNVKKATKRNLCRRIVKEFFRKNKINFENKNLIVIAKKSCATATKEGLWESIENFYQDLKK